VLGARDELAVPAAETVVGTAAPSGRAVRVPRTPVHLYGHHAVVGPFPEPGGAAPCARCLARRWQTVRSTSLRDALELGAETRATGMPPWAVPFTADALVALIAAHRQQQTATASAAGQSSGGGTFRSVYLVDLETLRIDRHPLIPDADCPDCSTQPDDSPETALPALRSVPKSAPDDFRQRPMDDYELPVQAFVNPVAGMLGSTLLPDLCSVSTSPTLGCFTVRSDGYLSECFWGGHTGSYRTSVRVGVLEGLERFAGMQPRLKRTAVHGSYHDLADRAVDPRSFGVYSDEFYQGEPRVRPFTPELEIPWVWGHSLRDRRPVLVPEIVAYFHTSGQGGNRYVQESSSGCASGGCLEEAVYFGLMETIERDAFLIAWYGMAELPEIDPFGSSRAETRAMVDRLAMYGYRVRFFDTRISFPIPVVTAVAERIDGGLGALSFGAGASLDPEAALAGGLCEIATDSVRLRRMAAHEQERLRAMAADHGKVEGLHDHPLVYGLPEMARHADFLLRGDRGMRSPADTFATNAIRPGTDLRDDVNRCVEAVTRAGFDVIVVDQTTPEQRALGFHAVKVLVPGLVPIDFGAGRQRALHLPRVRTALRDSGLRDRVLLAEDLNPAPHPFP
jgi:ribosomal protein S12 methylthiotransferase accessory factor